MSINADTANSLNPNALANLGLVLFALLFLFPILRVWFLELHDALSRFELFFALVAVMGVVLVVSLAATKMQAQRHARGQLDAWLDTTSRAISTSMTERIETAIDQLREDEERALSGSRCVPPDDPRAAGAPTQDESDPPTDSASIDDVPEAVEGPRNVGESFDRCRVSDDTHR